jgi:hypothetical protein
MRNRGSEVALAAFDQRQAKVRPTLFWCEFHC